MAAFKQHFHLGLVLWSWFAQLVLLLERAGCQGRRGFSRVISAAGCCRKFRWSLCTSFGKGRYTCLKQLVTLQSDSASKWLHKSSKQTKLLRMLCALKMGAHTHNFEVEAPQKSWTIATGNIVLKLGPSVAHHFRGWTMARDGLFNSGQRTCIERRCLQTWSNMHQWGLNIHYTTIQLLISTLADASLLQISHM
jgi:hypothetical protein